MDTENIYVVEHKLSSSKIQIACMLDANQRVRLSSIKMLSGKVVPLHGVRSALDHFKEENGINEEPNQPA